MTFSSFTLTIYTQYTKAIKSHLQMYTCQKSGITMEPHITPRVATHITLHVEAHSPLSLAPQDAILDKCFGVSLSYEFTHITPWIMCDFVRHK